MNFPKIVPAMTAATAVAALLLALPASAQTANSPQFASNAAPRGGSMMAMAKASPAPVSRPSTGTETAGTATGTDHMPKVANGLK